MYRHEFYTVNPRARGIDRLRPSSVVEQKSTGKLETLGLLPHFPLCVMLDYTAMWHLEPYSLSLRNYYRDLFTLYSLHLSVDIGLGYSPEAL